MYAVIGLAFVLAYLVGGSKTLVTDAAGVIWPTGSIAEAQATISIFTMLFGAALATVKLVQGSADTANEWVKRETGEPITKSDTRMVKEGEQRAGIEFLS